MKTVKYSTWNKITIQLIIKLITQKVEGPSGKFKLH